jgi:hypothetical protein
MSTITSSAASQRRTSAAVWVLAIASAAVWLGGLAYQLGTLPRQAAAPSDNAAVDVAVNAPVNAVSVAEGRAAAHDAQADQSFERYWAQVGRALGAL